MIEFNLQNARFDYEPFPICYIPDFLPPELYAELAATYPARELFNYSTNVGVKYSLSEINKRENYHRFLKETPAWGAFYEHVKSRKFIEQIAGFLKQRNIDLRLDEFTHVRSVRYRRRDPFHRIINRLVLRSRFEFSSLPAAGGKVLPHTDAPSKLVTLVVSMIRPDEWNEAQWGGGTSVVMPKDRTRIYNHFNKFIPNEEVDVLKTFPFVPNQCVLFIKTYNSWHSVEAMTGPADALRKTLTIVIESLP